METEVSHEMETEVSHEMETEGESGTLMAMAQLSRVSPCGKKNPNSRGQESVKVDSGQSARDKEVLSPETDESVTEFAKEAEEGALLVGLNSKGGESSMPKEAEEKSVKGSDMQQRAEELTAPVPDYYSRMRPKYREKLMELNKARAAEREALLARFEKLTQSNMGGNSADADSSIRDNNHADPRATKSMGQHSGNSAQALAKKTAAEEEMAEEAETFATYRTLWESKWRKTCGLFSHTTVLSSMQFTHYTPGRTPHSSSCFTPETLQIFSIKLTGLDGGLEFPLSVYGVVAIRDTVDRNRNILFSRDISDCQKLTENDPFLHLIGPSRAIVFTDKVCIEIQLRVVAGSQDKALISCARRYAGGNGPGVSTICFKNFFCTLELSLEPVKQTVQATILGVQVLDYNGSWPFEYGGLVACSPLSGEVVITDGRFSRNIDPVSSPIVFIDSKHEAMPKGNGGFVHLWRQVVSVQLQGGLDVVIKGYSKSGAVAAEASARFLPKVCNISQKRCLLGDAEVTITVAWSRVATSKIGVALENCARRCF